jgi:hypothetical protein
MAGRNDARGFFSLLDRHAVKLILESIDDAVRRMQRVIAVTTDHCTHVHARAGPASVSIL